MVDLREAGERLGFLAIQNLLFVHVHDVKLVFACRKSAFVIGFSLDFEKEPIAVAFSVCVWLQIQVEFAWLDLNS